MQRTLIALCVAFTFSLVGYVGAQTDPYGGQSTPSQSSQHSKSSKDVTLTGCLQQGADSNTFVLRNATEVSGESGSSSMGSSGSSSTSGSSGSSTSGTTGETQTAAGQSSMQSGSMDVQLVGKDLKKYVGQRVEIRGKVEPMTGGEGGSTSGSGSTSGTSGTSGSGSTAGGSTSGSGQSGSMGGSMSAGTITHRVKVKSVKQLGSSCQ